MKVMYLMYVRKERNNMKGEDLIKAIDILSEEKSIPKDDLFIFLTKQ